LTNNILTYYYINNTMKKALPWVFGIFVFVLLASFSLSNSSSYIKAAASHVVISQIQVAGTTNSNDEFVELYNPTDSSVDLTSWKLKKRTQCQVPTLVYSLSKRL